MNETQVLLGKIAGASELLKLMEKLCAGQGYFYCVSRTSLTDPAQGLPELAALASFDSGRVFCDKADIQWRRSGDSFEVIVLSDEKSDGDLSTLEGGWTLRKRGLALAGAAGSSGYVPVFPRHIRYPTKSGKAAELEVIEYLDEHSGYVQFTRLVGFKENV